VSSRQATTDSENMATVLTDYAAATWWGELCGAKIQEFFFGSRKYYSKQPFLESRELLSWPKKTGLMLQANITLEEEKKVLFQEKMCQSKTFSHDKKIFFWVLKSALRYLTSSLIFIFET